MWDKERDVLKRREERNDSKKDDSTICGNERLIRKLLNACNNCNIWQYAIIRWGSRLQLHNLNFLCQIFITQCEDCVCELQ